MRNADFRSIKHFAERYIYVYLKGFSSFFGIDKVFSRAIPGAGVCNMALAYGQASPLGTDGFGVEFFGLVVGTQGLDKFIERAFHYEI